MKFDILAISSYSCFQGFFDLINRFDAKSLNSTKSTVFLYGIKRRNIWLLYSGIRNKYITND
jgi:hypothetical protein